MGQYYKVVNITKKQYISPHAFNDGAKLMEFGCSAMGTMTGLVLLLANGNGRGGGDFHGIDPNGLVGSWAGDQIVISGDYSDDGVFCPDGVTNKNLYTLATEEFEDISAKVKTLILEDPYIKSNRG